MSAKQALRARRKLFDALKNAGSGIVVLVLLAIGFWGATISLLAWWIAAHTKQRRNSEAEVLREVTLPHDKVTSANIRLSEVACIDLQRTKTVAATIDYNATRHLLVKAPVGCVVERCLVKPGQLVAQGDALAVLSGAEIALARTELKKCQADVRLAQMNFDWSKETQDNLKKLLATLIQRPSVESIESQFDGKRLGEHRDHLLNAYTQYVLASSVAQRSKPLGDQGIIAGKTAEARSSQRNMAAATFSSACERSEFEGRQDLAKAQAELELARQNLAVAGDRLRLLLGPLAENSATEAPGEFELRAPFAGRIEGLHTSTASRLAAGEPVLTLADTTYLWVSALIHQHDWDALQVRDTETVHLTVPAIPGETFSAKVSFVGAEVSPSTRAVSLVAELDNNQGRFRPGMFAWVDLPMEPLRKGFVVPPSAIQRHDSAAFAFVVEGDNHFRRVDVVTGIETPEFVEITQGLSAGQKVVDRGAFFLKSELLLEQEE